MPCIAQAAAFTHALSASSSGSTITFSWPCRKDRFWDSLTLAVAPRPNGAELLLVTQSHVLPMLP